MSRYKIVRASDAETHSQEGGETTRFLATALETDGRVSIFDSALPQGGSAPWHYHETDDEIFYVISGEVEFGVADQETAARAGDLVIVGPNVARRFAARVDSRLLVINAPGGPSEGFLRDMMNLEEAPTAEDEARFGTKYGTHLGKP